MVADAVRFYSLRTDLMDTGAMIAPPRRLMREDLLPARGVNGETDYEWRLAQRLSGLTHRAKLRTGGKGRPCYRTHTRVRNGA
jgi:hypothetical protein